MEATCQMQYSRCTSNDNSCALMATQSCFLAIKGIWNLRYRCLRADFPQETFILETQSCYSWLTLEKKRPKACTTARQILWAVLAPCCLSSCLLLCVRSRNCRSDWGRPEDLYLLIASTSCILSWLFLLTKLYTCEYSWPQGATPGDSTQYKLDLRVQLPATAHSISLTSRVFPLTTDAAANYI